MNWELQAMAFLRVNVTTWTFPVHDIGPVPIKHEPIILSESMSTAVLEAFT